MPKKIERKIGDIVETNQILEELHRGKKIYYKVQCLLCGNIREVRADQLKNKCRSCAAKNRPSHIVDNLIGRAFGNWLVIDKAKKDNYWVCKDVITGTVRDVFRGNLISGRSRGDGSTRSWGEAQIKYFLNSNKIIYSQEYVFPDLKTDRGGTPRFDFAIFSDQDKSKLLYLIEYDGRQHFFYDENWKANFQDWEQIKKNDALKNEYCQKKHIPLYRISYNEDIEDKIINILTKGNN